ncbi:hypothetical protein [Clostridium sp.]|uniref:hypothetical protein n=1 Tax=Clostridium sp. TaxID=1506 RepID=UPI00262E0CC5|nr:hypothetical protein [uncultured Clostridium sp.]
MNKQEAKNGNAKLGEDGISDVNLLTTESYRDIISVVFSLLKYLFYDIIMFL